MGAFGGVGRSATAPRGEPRRRPRAERPPAKLGDAYTRTRQRLADPYGRPILWVVARTSTRSSALARAAQGLRVAAGVGSRLELRVLSRETGDVTYKTAADRIFDQLQEGWAEDGGGDMKRWMRGFDGKTAISTIGCTRAAASGPGGDSFHEYLLKEHRRRRLEARARPCTTGWNLD